MVELLCGDLSVAGIAEVACVLVHVLAALGERHDMVDNISEADDVALQAPLAEPVGASEPALALGLTCAAPEPLAHVS
jgi:hypothetical protein